MSKYVKIDDLRLHLKKLVLDGEYLESRTTRLILQTIKEMPIYEFDDEPGRSDMKIRTLVTVRCPECKRKLMEYIREHDQDPEDNEFLVCEKCRKTFSPWYTAEIIEKPYEV